MMQSKTASRKSGKMPAPSRLVSEQGGVMEVRNSCRAQGGISRWDAHAWVSWMQRRDHGVRRSRTVVRPPALCAASVAAFLAARCFVASEPATALTSSCCTWKGPARDAPQGDAQHRPKGQRCKGVVILCRIGLLPFCHEGCPHAWSSV